MGFLTCIYSLIYGTFVRAKLFKMNQSHNTYILAVVVQGLQIEYATLALAKKSLVN